MKEPRRGEGEESPDFYMKMRQPSPWQPDGSSVVLQRLWGQAWVRAGLEVGRGQARPSRRAGQSLQQLRGRMRKKHLSSGAEGLVDNGP